MKKINCRRALALFLLFVFPVVGKAYQERLVLSLETGECSIRFLVDDQAGMMRLRIHPGHPRCFAKKEDMQKILKAVFSKTDPPFLEGSYTSLFLGRLIDYPWLCEFLAHAAYKDKKWNKHKGKPVSMDINKYVSTLLMQEDFTLSFDEVLGKSGYRVIGVGVEKVLVGTFNEIYQYRGEMLPGKVPYDAMVWLRIEKR